MKDVVIKGMRFCIAFLTLLGVDFLLKSYIDLNIPLMSWKYPHYPYGGIAIFENLFGISFSINYVQNLGAAWGVLSTYSSMLFWVRLTLIITMVIYALFLNQEKKRNIPLLLIITGAIGNVLDFFVFGYVVDMFHFRFWGYSFPVFNFADSMITIGIFFLIMTSRASSEAMPKPAGKIK